MRKSKVCALALGLLALAVTARACFLGVPWQLLDNRRETLIATPSNSFAWEVSHWVSPSGWVSASVNVPPSAGDWVAVQQWRVAAENAGLAPGQQAALKAMRAAPGSDAAMAVAGDLPDAVRFYTAGAVAFANDDLTGAADDFRRVIALPAAQAAPRVVWAQFMLGRIEARLGKPEEAETAFTRTRALTTQGASDPLGLAIASLGESGRLRLDAGDVEGAVRLYAEQAADGSNEARDSLKMVAEDAMAHPDRLPALVSQPATQRLLVVYALVLTGDYLHALHTSGVGHDETPFTGFYPPEDGDLVQLRALLNAIETSNVAVVEMDRLAALAYRVGDYPEAQSLAERQITPLALWIRAKLSLQSGNRDESARLFAAALRATAETQGSASLEPATIGLLRGEVAVTVLAGGDFVQAATVLWPVGATYWGDLVYLAERVLTTNELKAFVGVHAAEPEHPRDTWPVNIVNAIRGVLARRLMRDGRYKEALPYFDGLTPEEKESRANAAALAGALRRSGSSFWAGNRAKAAWEAAAILRVNGMELTGTTTSPDYGLYGGFDQGFGPTDPPNFTDLEGIGPLQDERVRYDASRPKPDLRFHYRYLAVDQALIAADNLPARSQAFAAILCNASGWMMSSHADEKARALYLRYTKEGAIVPFATHFGHDCPDPDFSALSATRWKLFTIDVRDAIHQRKRSIEMAGVLLVLACGLGVIWVRRKS